MSSEYSEYSDEIKDHFNQVRPVKEPEEPPKEPPKSHFKPFKYVVAGVFIIVMTVYLIIASSRSNNDTATPQPILIQEPSKVQINIEADPDVTTHIEFIPDAGNEIIEFKPENEEPTVVLIPPKLETPRIIQSEPKKPAPVKIKITQTKKEPEKKVEEAAPKPLPEVSYGIHFFVGCTPKRALKPNLSQ